MLVILRRRMGISEKLENFNAIIIFKKIYEILT